MSDIAGHFLKGTARVIARTKKFSVEGLEQVPERGPVILAARHYHNLYDGVGLIAHVPRRLHILTGLDWVGTTLGRYAMERLTGAAVWPALLRTPDFSSDSDNPYAESAYDQREIFGYQRRAYRLSVDVLATGGVLVVFPEGYPLVDPHRPRPPRATLLATFQPGAASLALAAARRLKRSIDIVPVGIRVGQEKNLTMTFAFGAPQSVSEVSDADTVTTNLFQCVMRLSSEIDNEAHET